MADVNKQAGDTDLLNTLSKRVVMGDGAMCTGLLGAVAVETKYVRLQSG